LTYFAKNPFNGVGLGCSLNGHPKNEKTSHIKGTEKSSTGRPIWVEDIFSSNSIDCYKLHAVCTAGYI